VEVIHIGGNVRKNISSSIGPIAEASLRSIRVDKVFLGVNGVDFNIGLTTPNIFECQIKKAMMAVGNQTIVLADSTKFNQSYLSIICAVSDVYSIITDSGLAQSLRKKAADSGVRFMIVD
jgi:DeoR/GlpR family transcriptional regulator of sugar metabolism